MSSRSVYGNTTRANVICCRPVITLHAPTVTISASAQLQTASVTITDGESCPYYDPVTVYETLGVGTVVITETLAPETITEIQTVYYTAGRSYTSSRTYQQTTIIQTVTVTPAPLTVLQSTTNFVTLSGPTAYISQPCSNSPIYV